MANYDDTAIVSGSVAHISDGATDVFLKSCVLSLDASVEGYTQATLKQSGKNMLNPTTCQRGYIEYAGGIHTPGSVTQELYSDYIKVKPSTSYTFSATVNNSSEKWRGFGFYDKDKNFISRNAATSGTGESFSITATTPNNAYYLRCTWRNYSDISSGGSVCPCQLEEGSATSYEEYTEKSGTASFERTIYGGTVDVVNGIGTDENGNDFTFTPITPTPETEKVCNFWGTDGDIQVTYYKDGYGTTSVTVHKETPDSEPVVKTAKFHRIIYGGTADVIKGTCEPKNLLELYLARTSQLGVDFSLTEKGLLHIEGTNTSSTSSAFSGGNYDTYADCPLKFKAGTYTISALLPSDSDSIGSVDFSIRTKTDNTKTDYNVKTASKTITVNDDFGAWFWVSVLATKTINGDIGLQVEEGTSASEYTPYFEPFSFTPISMSTDEGENTLFATEGASAIIYRKQA